MRTVHHLLTQEQLRNLWSYSFIVDKPLSRTSMKLRNLCTKFNTNPNPTMNHCVIKLSFNINTCARMKALIRSTTNSINYQLHPIVPC